MVAHLFQHALFPAVPVAVLCPTSLIWNLLHSLSLEAGGAKGVAVAINEVSVELSAKLNRPESLILFTPKSLKFDVYLWLSA